MNTTTDAPTSSAKFLVCVDKEEESHTALRLAARRAATTNSVLEVLHIIPPADFKGIQSVAERMREEQRAEAEKMMRHICEEVFSISGIMPAIVLREGNPGDEIIAAAMEDVDVTLLVLGVSHSASRGKLTSWLAGQLGQKLFVPLLLVPGNLTDQQIEALT